ncbi:MAG: IS66 family transposase [Acidobacteria bacterium]|nr:IS66 family transposase [Acidobacteriota bacterium]
MLESDTPPRFQFNVDAVRARSHGDWAAALLDAEERLHVAEQTRIEAERSRLDAEQTHTRLVEAFAEVSADRDSLVRAREQLWKENKARSNELEVLYKRISELVQQLSEVTQVDLQQQFTLEIRRLQRRLDDRNQSLYGSSSERRGRPEGEGDSPAEKPEAKRRRRKRSGSRRTSQPKLPIVPVPHLLSAQEQAGGCKVCLGDLTEMKGQTEDHEQITVARVVYQLQLHQCQKYRCVDCGGIATAPGPEKIIAGGRYSPEFAVHSAVLKYADHLPLERQVRQMSRAGLNVTSQALWDQHRYLALLLLPTLLALHALILTAALCYADETPWRMMKKLGSKRWWMWTVSDGRLVYYQAVTSRGNAAGRELLRDFAGLLMADDYVVYNSLEHERTRLGGVRQVIDEQGNRIDVWTPDFTLLTCWMHARRYLFKAEKHQPTAGPGVDIIGALYKVEADAEAEVDKLVIAAIEASKPISDEDQVLLLLQARREHRERTSRGLIAKLDTWRKQVIRLEGSALADALKHMDRLWPRLVMFLEDARIPLDNGHAERQIRGPVLGRVNFQGNRSEDGAMVTAALYSLIRSAINLGLNPEDYMNEALRRAIAAPGSIWLPTDHLDMLRERGEAPVMVRRGTPGARISVPVGSVSTKPG